MLVYYDHFHVAKTLEFPDYLGKSKIRISSGTHDITRLSAKSVKASNISGRVAVDKGCSNSSNCVLSATVRIGGSSTGFGVAKFGRGCLWRLAATSAVSRFEARTVPHA